MTGFLVGLGILAALATVAWIADSRTGWRSLDGDARLSAVERFSGEASRIAQKPVSIGCDEARDYVGYVQHADGVAIVGGDRAYITPEICFALYRLAFEDDVRGEPDRPCDRGPRSRGLASPRRKRRGNDRVLRASDRGGAGPAAGARRRHGAPHDGSAARREHAPRSREPRLPRVRECRDGGRLDLDPDRSSFP